MRNIKPLSQFIVNENANPSSLTDAVKSEDAKAIKAAISALVKKLCEAGEDGPVKFSVKFDSSGTDGKIDLAARVKSDFYPEVIAKKFAAESGVFVAQEHESSNRRLVRWVCDLKPGILESSKKIEFLSVYFQ